MSTNSQRVSPSTSLKIVSFDASSLKNQWNNNFNEFIKIIEPDIICIQDIIDQSEENFMIDNFKLNGYHGYFFEETFDDHLTHYLSVYTKYSPTRIFPISSHNENDNDNKNDAYLNIVVTEYDKFILFNVRVPSNHLNVQKYFLNLSRLLKVYHTDKILIICGSFGIMENNLDVSDVNLYQQPEFIEEEIRTFKNFIEENELIELFRFKNPNLQQFTLIENDKISTRFDYFFTQKKNFNENFIIDALIHSCDLNNHFPIEIVLNGDLILSQNDKLFKKTEITNLNQIHNLSDQQTTYKTSSKIQIKSHHQEILNHCRNEQKNLLNENKNGMADDVNEGFVDFKSHDGEFKNRRGRPKGMNKKMIMQRKREMEKIKKQKEKEEIEARKLKENEIVIIPDGLRRSERTRKRVNFEITPKKVIKKKKQLTNDEKEYTPPGRNWKRNNIINS
ncbi:hypothetical protein TRFO_31337 [Tritrichomonas foetus]|uniref:Endonuclease/exonuclease/phosphatase domain-containing protein n=1 Tax=Tritrichomonas foetus TaxID=1144522 RepID=A0A1J4JRE9_9EUKA|nr:hypothetical protein TRFO_31337 [Tritrichomonas foetus]|eukprot:OHT01727.1 hypothetical protein TRFO_31337 [Tritrichomonas foetus]